MTKRPQAFLLPAFLIASALCAAPRVIPWEKNHLKIGQALYRENCAVCHDVDREKSKKIGPSFYQLFRREKMPRSNVRPNRPFIAVKIRIGGQIMPAFGKKLTPAEIETLVTTCNPSDVARALSPAAPGLLPAFE